MITIVISSKQKFKKKHSALLLSIAGYFIYSLNKHQDERQFKNYVKTRYIVIKIEEIDRNEVYVARYRIIGLSRILTRKSQVRSTIKCMKWQLHRERDRRFETDKDPLLQFGQPHPIIKNVFVCSFQIWLRLLYSEAKSSFPSRTVLIPAVISYQYR